MEMRRTWHVDAIADHLQAVTDGHIQRLCINIPPGHAKSLLVSVFWPAWVWTHRPEWRGLFSAYAGDLALRDSVRCRSLIESPWYDLFQQQAGWELAGDQNVKSYFANTRTGFRMALSVGGKATGFRGDAVVVDDPLNAKEAPSKLVREEAVFWWDKVMSSRLNDMRKGARVIIMQRLHEDDLSGYVLSQGGYEHLCLPSEFDPKRKSITFIKDNPLAQERRKFFEDPRKEAGELLFPELFPQPVLDQAKKDLGSDGFAGQHDQKPTPAEGGMFKKKWWRFWKPDGVGVETYRRPDGCNEDPARPIPKQFDNMIISVDAAFKDLEQNDWVVLLVIGCVRADRFILERVRGHFGYRETVKQIKLLCSRHPLARRKLIEDKANGSAVIDTLQTELSGIIAVNPEGGKESRASAVSPQIESGNVYLPEGAGWLEEWVEEFASFPRGKHDDQVDSLSQGLLDLYANPGMARAIAMASM